MARKMTPGTTEWFSIEVNGVEYEFLAKVSSIGNNGIGPYECHGYRGYDHGQDYVEEFEVVEIRLDSKKISNGDKAGIENLIYQDDDLVDQVLLALGEKTADEEDAEPPDSDC